MFKFLRSKRGQGMVEYGLIICAVAIAAIIGLNSLGQNNADRTMEIAETLEDANASYEAEQKDLANKESIGNFNSGNGGYYSGSGGGGLGSFPSYSGGVNWRPTTKEDGTVDTNDRIGTIDEEATEDAPVLNDDAPEGNQAPIASFYVSNQNNIRVGQSLTFYNTSTDPDGDQIVKEEWQGIPTGNKFTLEGSYEVKLRVVDEWGNWSQWTKVTLEVKNSKPIAIITSSPDFDNGDEFDKTQIFQWSSTASYDPDNHRIVDEEWRGKNNYYEAGEHTVELRVQDEFGTWSNWVSKTFTIYNGSKPVIVSGTLSDAKNNTWSTDLLMQGQDEIPELLSGKDIYFKAELTITDEDRDTIKAIQYRVDGTTINALYNTQNRGNDEEKQVTSANSPNVPIDNTLSPGTHSIEVRVQDYNGAWSTWTAPIYIRVIDAKAEDPENPDEEVQYMTMDIFNFNTSSNSAFGGNRGPWYAGNFIILPTDQTGATIKDAVVMVDDVEIESTFETIAGVPAVKFNYSEVGSHTIKAKFQDENDIWSDWVENSSFNLIAPNITFTYDTYYDFCDYYCDEFYIQFATANTGSNSEQIIPTGYFYDYQRYFYYQNPTGGNIDYINVKINDVITKVENIRYTNDSTGEENTGNISGGFYGILNSYDFSVNFLTEDKTVSFQVVDVNGFTSAWTNEVTFSVGEIEDLPDTADIEEVTPPYITTYTGWTPLFTDEDDYCDSISMPSGKTISFGGNTYSNLYVNSNGSVKFDGCSSSYGGSHTSGNSSTTNSIVLIGNIDLASSTYYKHTNTGVDVMFKYARLGSGSLDKTAIASINFDGTGSIYFIEDQDTEVMNSTNKTFVKTVTGNYSELTNAVGRNKAYSWSVNTSSSTPYYVLEEINTIPNYELGEVKEFSPIYINGSKIQTSLLAKSSDELAYDYYVYEFNGSLTFKNTTTGTEYTGTYSASNDYGYTGNQYYLYINDIPGLTSGEYELRLDSANVIFADSSASPGTPIPITAEPVNITLIEQQMSITNITYSYSSKAHQLNISTNNYGSKKDLLEIKIDDIDFTQKATQEEAIATENSFKFTETTNSSFYAYIYNSDIFSPGSTHTVKARFRITGSELWSDWVEKQFTVPELTVSSVSVTGIPSKNISTLTVNLSNYTGKYPVGVKVEIDDAVIEDTSFTTTTLSNSFISKFTKEIPLLTVGSHNIKTTVVYKINENSETTYEAVKTTSYTQGDYSPSITGMSRNSGNSTTQSFKVNYRNTYNVGMYTHKQQVFVNDVDVSEYVTNGSTSLTYAYMNIPNEYFVSGNNVLRVKTFYRTANNLFLEYNETNEYAYSYSFSSVNFDSLSVNTSSTTIENLYLSASFTNPLYKPISNIVIKVNDEIVESEITNSGATSATIKIDTPVPTTETTNFTITAIVTIAGEEYEKTTTYALKVPSNSPRTSLSHENKTTTSQEYIWFYVYTDVKNEINKEDLILQNNGIDMAIDRISTSWSSSSSYSTNNGTMKYRGTVYVYLDDFYYRPGTYSFTAKLNYGGTELNYASSGTYSSMGTISNYIYADTKSQNQLSLYLQYGSGNYYRVKELKVKEYTDSTYTTLISEITTPLKNGLSSYYYYVGTTSREFEPINIENPNQVHYYKLSFVTPWGEESTEKTYVFQPQEQPIASLNVVYNANGQFKTTLSTNIFNTTKESLISGLELKVGETIYPYTKKSSTLANQGSTSTRSYLSVSWQNTSNNNLISPTYDENNLIYDETDRYLREILQYRIKYSDNTYSDWYDITTLFWYPEIYEISAIETNDKMTNNLYVTTITVEGTELYSTETFNANVFLDGVEQEVVDLVCSDYSCEIDIVQPENGIYNELTVSLDYSAYDKTLTTKTISKEDVVIYREEEALTNSIPVTRTLNTTIPSYNLSDFTKITTEISTTPVSFNLSTPINFFGETINTLSVNRASIGFGEFTSLPNVLLRTDTETQIRNNKTRTAEYQIAFFPSTFNIKADSAFTNSGIYYKEDSTKVYILYKNVWSYYFFGDTDTELPIQNTPHFDIYIEINKDTGSGNVYFGDMNKENNATIQEYLEGTSENLSTVKRNQAMYSRTFFVKHSETHYGYLEPIESDMNVDTMYSNTMFSWGGGNQSEPPIINSATVEKTTNTDTPITITEVLDFDYTGAEQTYVLPIGTHTLEVWGAQGGSTPYYAGGKGGYSTGILTLSEPTEVYVYVGGEGVLGPATDTAVAGGFNGGGASSGSSSSSYRGASGGGATHIATSPGELHTLSDNKDSVLIVAGAGGGGAGVTGSAGIGGYGGGLNGGNGVSYSSGYGAGGGATQTSGGINAYNSTKTNSNMTFYASGFGKGGYMTTTGPSGGWVGGGGGAGYYGGGAGGAISSGGGGSGFVNSTLSAGDTINGNSSFPAPQGDLETGHSGNGFARITINGISNTKTKVTVHFTSRSNTTTVSSAKLITQNGTIIASEFEQMDANTIVFDNIVLRSNIPYIYAWLELDDGLYSNNKKIDLNKVNISNATINSNNSEYTEITLDIANSQNTTVREVSFEIIDTQTNEEIELGIQNINVTNSSANIKIDKIPQNKYVLKARVIYDDYGLPSTSREFSKIFDTYVSDLDNSSSGIKPTMEPTTYPNNISTSTSGYTTLFSNSDDTAYSFNLPSGKKIKFGNNEFSRIYINPNGHIKFSNGNNPSNNPNSSNAENSITMLGGYDLRAYAYYKFTEEGVEILFKYTRYGYSDFNYYIKALVRYNGSGELYYIGSPRTDTISNAATFVKTTGTNYDLEIAPGTATVATYTNAAYKWYFGASKEEIPTITNLSVDQSILNGGRTATLTITTDKPITAADIYVGSGNLISTKELTKVSDYSYTTEISVPNNNNASTIPIKVSAYYLNAQSYWKEINVPFAKSPAPTITNVTGISSSFKEGHITNATISYNTSTLNNPVTDVIVKYVDEDGEKDLLIENKEILTSTINITGLDFSTLSSGTGNIILRIKDNTDIYSDDYIIPVTITKNEAPVITNVSIPLEADGKLHYKKKLTFTIDYEDVENDELTYVYYRTKTSTGSWSSTTNIALPNDSVERVDENTIKVTINGYLNSEYTLDYEFSIKDNYYKSEPVVKTYNVTQNIVPEITELVSQTETSVGSTIELSALYTDYEEEYSPSTIQEIYVYVDGNLTDLYQNAYASNNTIKVRNLLLNSPGEHTISLMAKDTYGKMTNKKEVQINVIPSTSPVLFSYDIDTVILDKDITLKNIFYENSERGTGIDAIEYSIDGATPVVIDFENTITENNFTYSLPNTAFSTPDTEIKYIFVRIKDTTGTWSTSLMGTFTVGYTNDNTTTTDLYIDGYDYMYSEMFGDYSPIFDINDTIFINYLYGKYPDNIELIPVIDGVEIPEILNDYYQLDKYCLEYVKLTFDNISAGNHKIEILLKDDTGSSYVYNLGTYYFADLSQSDIFFVPNTVKLTGKTNTDLTLSGYLAVKDYEYMDRIDYMGNAIITEAVNIPGVNVEDYTFTRTSLYRDYYLAFYVSYKLNFTEPIADKSLLLTHQIVDVSNGADNTENEVLSISPQTSIPLEIVENISNLETNWTVTFNSFVNKQKTVKDAILAGDLKLSLNYKVTNPTSEIENIKLYIDNEEYPITTPELTGSVSGNTKTGVISAEFTYETLGTHVFEIVATTNTGEELRYSIEKNIVHKATPAFEVRDGNDTVVNENTTITLIDGNPILTFNFTDDSGTIYRKQQIKVNNVIYDFPGEKTINFSNLNQGYYEIKVLLESDYETITKTYFALDPGVTKIVSNIYMGDGRRITIPSSIFLFGQTYNSLYIEPTGIISPTHYYYSGEMGEITDIKYYSNLILPVQAFDDWAWYGGQINGVYYKNFIDNLTLYIDATDPNGNRIFYSVAFYNRDILKFNYYIVENSLAEKQLAGVVYDSDSFVVTNTRETGLKDNTTVTIDTYRMLAN